MRLTHFHFRFRIETEYYLDTVSLRDLTLQIYLLAHSMQTRLSAAKTEGNRLEIRLLLGCPEVGMGYWSCNLVRRPRSSLDRRKETTRLR